MTFTNAPAGGIDQTEFNFLVDKNADGIIVVDARGVVLFANPAAETIFGRPSTSLVGSPIGVPLVVNDTTQITIHRPNSDQIEAEVRVVETVWDHQPARLASLRDVSARAAMEERLRHSAKMEAIGRLTAGIAHDFNNLLTVVLGNLESALRRSDIDDSALTRALENATRGARRAASLTERLLAFARRKPLEPHTIDVNSLVAAMSELMQRTLGEGVWVETKLAAGLWSVDVDPTELEAAILNLAVNAQDAMPQGGRLMIQTENVTLAPGSLGDEADVVEGPFVLLTATDTGSGMSAEVLEQAFEPFFTTKTDGRGTGLGLSQVYGFVKQSGGFVQLASVPGQGTSVKLYLPRSASEPERPNRWTLSEWRLTDAAPISKGSETILIVEDDVDVRAYVVESLRELGYQALEASDALAALSLLEARPDVRLLFTDLGLPGGVDGRLLAARARTLRPDLPILIATAYAGAALRQGGRLDSEVDLLTKPFTLPTLASRIRDRLDRAGGAPAAAPVVLVVDDEDLVRDFLVDALGEFGCKADGAASFAQALAKMEQHAETFAGLIVDIGLPDRPGDELARTVRARWPQTPVILTTGADKAALNQSFAADPRVRALAKPFDCAALADMLRDLGVRA